MPKRERRQSGEHWLTQPHGDYWYDTWYDAGTGRERRRSTGHRDFREAQKEVAKRLLTDKKLRNADPSDVYLAIVLDDYLTYMEGRPSHDAAVYAVEWMLGKVDKSGAKVRDGFLEGKTVGNLTLDTQEKFMRDLRGAGHADSYIDRTMSVLSASLRRAHQSHVLHHAPYVTNSSAIHDDTTPLAATRELARDPKEIAEFMKAIRSEHVWNFALVCLNTLARPSTAYDLTRFQCSIDDRLIDLNPPGRKQTKKRRPIVPMTDTIIPIIKASEGHLVAYHGRPIACIKKAIRLTSIEAGLEPRFTPKTFRHSMAKHLRRQGVDPWQVSGIMGHRRAETTERYAVYAPDYLSDARKAIDGLFNSIRKQIDAKSVFVSRKFHANADLQRSQKSA